MAVHLLDRNDLDVQIILVFGEQLLGGGVGAGELAALQGAQGFEAGGIVAAAARAELDSARAQLRHARAQLVRASNLKKNKSISDELLDQRRMELETGEAQVGVQQERLQQAAIDARPTSLPPRGTSMML